LTQLSCSDVAVCGGAGDCGIVMMAATEELRGVVTAGAHGTDAPPLHSNSARSSVVVVVAAVLTRAEPLTAAARKGY
jgi:hypothetical protein